MPVRLKIFSFCIVLIFLGLVSKLFYWQVIRGKDLARQARGQHEAGLTISAPRGSILASDGTYLAARGEAFLVYAEVPKLTASPKDIANTLAPFFIEDKEDRAQLLAEVERIQSLLSKKEAVWVPIKQKVNVETKKNIEALKLTGIGFEKRKTVLTLKRQPPPSFWVLSVKTKKAMTRAISGLKGFTT